MTPRAARRQIAELANEERDNALRRAANLEAEIQQLRDYASQMDMVTKAVGIRTEPWVVASMSALDQPAKLPAGAMFDDRKLEIPEFERDHA